MKTPEWFEALPAAPPSTDRWQVSVRPLSISVSEGEQESWQPRILLIVEAGTGAVLGHRLLQPDADPDLVLDLLLSTMSAPALGEPRRPRILETDTEQLLPFLKELSDQMGFEIRQSPDLPELSYAIHSFEEFVQHAPGLYLDEEGADPKAIAAFFQSAAAFYRAAPWERIHDSEPLTLFYEDWEAPKYAVVMGYGGIIRGVALYDDAEDLADLYEDVPLDPSELECTAVTFEDREELSEDQWEEIRSNGWEVASEEAIPLAIRTDAIGPPRNPSMEQLRHLEIALYLLPEIVKSMPDSEEARRSLEPQGWEIELYGQLRQGLWGYGILEVEEQAATLNDGATS
ncbi:MAG: hypothetical protein KY468_01160 [Armatimonadetes bacterium]|nr:hypothetical protein [Armatimonadota bacterium]